MIRAKPVDPANHDPKGFSLVEVLVTIGVLALITFGIVRTLDSQFKTQQNSRELFIRDILSARLSRLGGNSIALRESAAKVAAEPANKSFAACVDGTATLCTQTAANADFVLYDSFGAVAVSGTTAKPMRYTASGDVCGPNDTQDKCPLSVRTQFRAICAGNAASCANAEAINVTFDVKLTSKEFSAGPAGAYGYSANVVTKVSRIFPRPPSKNCSAGSFVSAIGADGSVQTCNAAAP